MSIYIRLLLTATIVVYIVDVSGFTLSWRRLLSGWLRVPEERLKRLPPFDCGKCATFWACIITAALYDFSLATVVFACGMSLLSNPIGQVMIFIREGLLWLIDKISFD